MDELVLRGVKLTSHPHAVQRDLIKVLDYNVSAIEKDCIWYDLTCVPSVYARDEQVQKSILLDENGRFVVRTAVPAAGALVGEFMQYRHATEKTMYTYIGMTDMEPDDFSTVTCIKMSTADSRIYRDRFHLLSPFTSMYVLAVSGDGHAMISSSTGMKNNLRIF